MSTLEKALADKDTLVLDIHHAAGGVTSRCPASMWWHEGGLLWADVGWPNEPGHAFHFFPGEISGEGPWTVIPDDAEVIRSIVVRQIVTGEQPAMSEFLTWEEFRVTPQGQPYTAVAALEGAANFFSFDAQRGR